MTRTYHKSLSLFCILVLILFIHLSRFESGGIIKDPKSVAASPKNESYHDEETLTSPPSSDPSEMESSVMILNQKSQDRPLPFDRYNPSQKRYPRSPFKHGGYRTTGGVLPVDAADYLEDPKMWRYVDNATCRDTKPPDYHGFDHLSWQHRAPYAILLGGMKWYVLLATE